MNRTIRLSLLLAAAVSLPGCLEVNPPRCAFGAIALDPGECGTITNLCSADGQWQPNDGLTLFTGLADRYSFMLETLQQANGVVERRICSDVGNQPSDQPSFIEFLYSTPGNQHAGAGGFDITTTAELRVSLVADPAAVKPGEKARLQASVAGGLAPYTYAWTPAGDVAGEGVLAVKPKETTEYGVVVTDARGKIQRATATVNVIPETCGNAIVEPPETCDDGNNEDGDKCSSTCQLEKVTP